MINDLGEQVGSAQVIDGVLTVVASSGDNDIMLGSARNDPDQIFVLIDYVSKFFPRSEVTAISMDMGDGNDSFGYNNFTGLVNLPPTLKGGAGNDELGGETARNYMDEPIEGIGTRPFAPVHLIGGEGDDFLGGGIGDAIVEGGPGNNRMYPRKGLFTVSDAPPKEPAPPPPVHVPDEGSSPIFLDDTFAAIVNFDSQSEVQVVVSNKSDDAITTEGDARGELVTSTPAPIPIAPKAATTQDSFLTSKGSLLRHSHQELWN